MSIYFSIQLLQPNPAFLWAQAVQAAAEQNAIDAREEVYIMMRKARDKLSCAPSEPEMEAAKRNIQWKDHLFHFAIAGVAGGGKSSLINHSAACEIKIATRLQLVSLKPRWRWPDILITAPTFLSSGLYVFDCIMVLFDDRFTITNIAILTNAKRLIQSKADLHIRNMVKEIVCALHSDEGEDNRNLQDQLYKVARTQFIANTHRKVKVGLEKANLPDQRVYIISRDTLLGIVQGKQPKNAIDEIELLMDLHNEAHA